MTQPVTIEHTTWNPFSPDFSPEDYARGQSHFQMAFIVVPSKARRQALNDLYAFCRVADDISDRSDLSATERAILIERMREWIQTGVKIGHPFWDRFLGERIRFGLVNAPLEGIIAGVEQDIARKKLRFETWLELDYYVYGVACCVGEATLALLGANGPQAKQYSDQMGKCLQYLNIMRDLEEDRQLDRIYIPQEYLRKNGWSDLPPEPERQKIRDELYRRASLFRANAKSYSWRCLPAELMARIYLKGAKKYWRFGNPKRLSSFQKFSAALGC